MNSDTFLIPKAVSRIDRDPNPTIPSPTLPTLQAVFIEMKTKQAGSVRSPRCFESVWSVCPVVNFFHVNTEDMAEKNNEFRQRQAALAVLCSSTIL